MIHAGPYDLPALARGDVVVFEALRAVYALALRRIYLVALAAGVAAAVCTFGMEWKNVKRVQKARREEVGEVREEKEAGEWREGQVEGGREVVVDARKSHVEVNLGERFSVAWPVGR